MYVCMYMLVSMCIGVFVCHRTPFSVFAYNNVYETEYLKLCFDEVSVSEYIEYWGVWVCEYMSIWVYEEYINIWI